jgi:hypothetical protein
MVLSQRASVCAVSGITEAILPLRFQVPFVIKNAMQNTLKKVDALNPFSCQYKHA